MRSPLICTGTIDNMLINLFSLFKNKTISNYVSLTMITETIYTLPYWWLKSKNLIFLPGFLPNFSYIINRTSPSDAKMKQI